jgi:hypothetical protein
MERQFTAIYRSGTLIPLQPLDLPEESVLKLKILTEGMVTSPPEGGELPERPNQPPVYRIAGLFTRDELHERR